MMKKISELKPGDMVDLEGDQYADPKSDRIEFETEYAVVASTVRETDECIAVYLEGVDCFGFPPNHLVKVVQQ